jgi:RNA polymerase sigma-70 factor, ECF subfamily
MEPLSDEELVAKYRALAAEAAGDSFLNELFQRHHKRVAFWCLRLTGDRESAADLAQEVFLKAFRNLDSFRGDSKFTTWLYSIARNQCFNEIKTRAARPEQIGDALLSGLRDPSMDPQSELERASAARLLRDLMAQSQLTEQEAQVMVLHYAEELPLEAITRLLNLGNISGAKAHIVSAKRKLARAIRRWKARGEKMHGRDRGGKHV